MKFHPLMLTFFCCSLLLSCKKPQEPTAATPQEIKEFAAEVRESTNVELKKSDRPILSLTKGDTWLYEVKVQIPENAQAAGTAAVNQSFERKRTYVGKVKPSGNHPETDCFEIESKGSPIEREFVEIDEERVMMRGSEIVGSTQMLPLWLDPAVMLVRAGVIAGESLPPIKIKDPRTGLEFMRGIQIVGRETITAAGRDFATIRILMTGKDGTDKTIEMRRTIWFAPQFGIVKEEKSRYINDAIVLKESIELKSLELKSDTNAVKEQ